MEALAAEAEAAKSEAASLRSANDDLQKRVDQLRQVLTLFLEEGHIPPSSPFRSGRVPSSSLGLCVALRCAQKIQELEAAAAEAASLRAVHEQFSREVQELRQANEQSAAQLQQLQQVHPPPCLCHFGVFFFFFGVV
jgi:hypothetical protein